MKKTFLQAVVATAVVASAVAFSSIAAFAATHTFTAPSSGNIDSTYADGYFTVTGTLSYKSSSGYNTVAMPKGGGTYISFTPEGSATLKVSFGSTGSGNDSVIDLCNNNGKSLEQQTVTGQTPTEKSFDTSLEAGTTYRIANLGSRDSRIVSVTVEETGAANYPTFDNATTDTVLDGGKSDTASATADITNLEVGATAGTVEQPYDDEILPGFKVYGNVSEDTFSGMTVEANTKSLNGKSYTNRLKTNGVGSVDKNSIQFTVEKDSTVEIIAMSGNSSSVRPVIIASADGTELASENLNGSSLSAVSFAVKPGTYSIYAGNCISGTDGGINIYGLNVYDGVVYKLPVVSLSNDGDTDEDGKIELVASVNDDFTAGQLTGMGFLLAKPDAETTTKIPVTYYTTSDGKIVFKGLVKTQNLKAQAYVTFESVVDGSTVTRLSNTVTNTVE
jgi:hypothetical protein